MRKNRRETGGVDAFRREFVAHGLPLALHAFDSETVGPKEGTKARRANLMWHISRQGW